MTAIAVVNKLPGIGMKVSFAAKTQKQVLRTQAHPYRYGTA
jgi:hypothetical protein